MSKENEIELMSYTENGQRWLQCKSCYDYKKVDEGVKAVTCSRCTMVGTLKRKPMDEFFAGENISLCSTSRSFQFIMDDFMARNMFEGFSEQTCDTVYVFRKKNIFFFTE